MIIGLSGYAGSGKDEIAKILVEDFGYKRIAFADPIRELLYEMDPPVEVGGEIDATVGLQNFVDVYGWDTAKRHLLVRSMLQNLGVGARKVFGDSFWVYQALSDVAPQDKIVVSDVRFKNEAEFIQTFNGKIWRVNRPGVNPVNNHASEVELNGLVCDTTITNEGTLEELKSIVRKEMGK
jgi:hypothetical protein